MPPVKKPVRHRHVTYIKAWREFRNLSQERVAERIGISRENYGRIEAGKIPYNQDFLEVCADALNCSVSDLLEKHPGVETAIDQVKALLQAQSPGRQNQILEMAKTLIRTSTNGQR